MANRVTLAPEYFGNPTIGRPVANGSVYVGEIDLNPKIEANQKQISVLQEDGTEVEVSQPLGLSVGGYPTYNGSPVTILVTGSYSLRVDDKNDAQVYYVPKNAEATGDKTVETIADLRLISGDYANQGVNVQGYYAVGDGGGGPPRYWDEGTYGPSDDNGCSVIVPTGVTTGAWLRGGISTDSALEWGAVGDGVTGASQAIQDMMTNASGKTCVVPYSGTGTYILDAIDAESCLKPPANTTLIIEPGVTLQAATGIGASVRLIFTVGNNIEIVGYGATLTGIKAEYTSGEDRHGISASRTGFALKGLTIEDTGGDGIYIGESANDVTLTDVKTNNVRRNGLSVIACTNFLATNCQFDNSNGINPQMGVDIEPNNNNYDLINVKFYACSSSGNENHGFNVSPSAIQGANDRIIDVSFVDCIDNGSGNGFGAQEIFINSNNVTGQVNFIRCQSQNAGLSGFSFRNYDALAPRINVENPVVVDANTEGSTTLRVAAPISVYNEAGDTGASNIGNVTITNPSVSYTGTPPLVPDYYFGASGAAGLTDVHLIDPIKLGNGNQEYYMTFAGSGSVSDKHRLMIYNGVKTINGDSLATIFQNTAPITYTLSLSPVGFPDLLFEVTDENDYLTVVPDGTSFILPGGGAGKYIRALSIGARLRLRRRSTTQWVIVEQVGTWTFEP